MGEGSQGLIEYSGLLFECPLKEQIDSCVFKNIHTLDIMDRLEYWKNLSDKDKHYLINQHHICIFEREQPRISNKKLIVANDIDV